MTAEIAILNRTAVALAADSAVTITIRGHQKTNHSGDKIFQLVQSEPVGIMIYGNVEFMGVPFETMVKEFRASAYAKPRDTLKEYSEAFFEFMQGGIKRSDRYFADNIFNIVFGHLNQIHIDAVERLLAQGQRKESQKKVDDILEIQIAFIADSVRQDFEAKKDNRYVKTIEGDSKYAEIIDRVIETIFTALNDNTRELLRTVAYLSLKKDVFSKSFSGIVFAGFGRKEIFPKVHSFYSDGHVGGGIKRLEAKFVDIDRDGVSAHIEPFAQKEMVERFLDGIDSTFEEYIFSSMETALSDLGKEIVDRFIDANSRKKSSINGQVRKVVASYLENFKDRSGEWKQSNHRQRVLDMVHYMSKSDLANIAESLISLTATKRRVSVESETVGGPTDVAVISKHEGFVWIKRKHYFDASLNPRYFLNQQREIAGRDDNANGYAK